MSNPIASIMHRIVCTVGMDDTVGKVEAMMESYRISSAPVYDMDGTMLGIITSTDLLKFHAAGRNPATAKAWEICTYRPIEVRPETSIAEVAELMLTHKIHHVVVMDRGALQGIVSSLDFVRLFVESEK